MTLRDYIRLQCGDTELGAQTLSDAEIQDFLIGAVLNPNSPKFVELAQLCLTSIRVLNRAGWVELKLTAMDRAGVKFGCGIGGWLDEMTDAYVGDNYYSFDIGEGVNNLTGIVEFSAPPSETVYVRTYIVDLKRAVHDALMAIAGNEARLAVRAEAAGVGADLTKLAGELRAQAKEALGNPIVKVTCSGEYPH